MNSYKVAEQIAGGMDQRFYPGDNAATVVENFRYDPSGGWRNDRGWEPLIPIDGTTYVAPNLTELFKVFSPCRFLSIIQRHQGSEEYYLQERGGELFYEFGNIGAASSRKITLDTGRNDPKPDDPGTQAIPYGRFTLIVNGYNKMLKWWGRSKVEQFGFYQRPPTPVPLNIDTEYNTGNTPPVGNNTNINLAGTAIQFALPSLLGLGNTENGSINTNSYKITYVTDTGSESPLSSEATVSWTIPTTDPDAPDPVIVANQVKYGVVVTGLDPGPDGVVARRIYRTKNKEDGVTGYGDIYYFHSQIDDNTTTTIVDVAPDNQLVIEAPSITDSVTISTGYKFGAAWNGSMWLAGGEANPTKLIYSVQGLPEQFGAFNYFDVGVRDGGHITALYPYYDVLLVFRERCIDAVFTNAAGDGYTCTTINKDVGTTATNSIKLVPGFGVIFINKDGFWLLRGGLRGGATITVESLAQKIEREMKRLSKNALARAVAAYSDREKEYWCLYSVDGNTENTRGASFNTVTGVWSIRGAPSGTDVLYDWRFTQIATDQSGYFILGTKPTWDAATPGFSNPYPGLGLQVWTAHNYWGYTGNIISEEGYYVNWQQVAKGLSTWQSTWTDFGDDSVKKRVISVEMDVLTEGDNEVELQWAQDWGYDWNSAGTVPVQRADVAKTSSQQPTYVDTAAFPTPIVGKNPAVWNVSKWQEPRVTRLRWDVRTGLIDQFAFKIITSNIVQITRYQIQYIPGQLNVRNVNAPGAKL